MGLIEYEVLDVKDGRAVAHHVDVENFKNTLRTKLTTLLSTVRAEAYEKGQDDAFRGKIESMSSITVKETYDVPYVLQEAYRNEGRADERARIVGLVPEEKNGMNGENLPFENSPEIYGNQRIESYKKGWRECRAEFLRRVGEK